MIITLLIFVVSPAYSQYSEVGFFGGGSFYNGDVNPGKQFLQTRPSFGAIFRYNLDTRLAARFSVYRGSLTGNESDMQVRPYREAEFDGNVTEFSLLGEFNFLKYFTGSSKNVITPFLFGGIGYHFYGGDYAVSYGNEQFEYSGSGLAVPFGIGVKYSLSEHIGLAAEWGYRKIFTDELDGLPGTYDELPVDDNSLHGVQLSNTATNDWYSFAGLSLTLNLDIFKREICEDLQRKQEPKRH